MIMIIKLYNCTTINATGKQTQVQLLQLLTSQPLALATDCGP